LAVDYLLLYPACCDNISLDRGLAKFGRISGVVDVVLETQNVYCRPHIELFSLWSKSAFTRRVVNNNLLFTRERLSRA
jgi:hypothetical protein